MEIKNIDDWSSLLVKAENGDGKAQNEVAYYYENGLTIGDIILVEVDPKLAFHWTKRAYGSGDIDGMQRYADYLSDGEYQYCEKDIDLAMQIYERAMNEGSGSAAYSLGLEYRNKQNFEKAFELYSIPGKSGNFYEELTVGLCYYYGIGTKKDRHKAFEIFKLIHTDSSGHSQYEIEEANFMIGRIFLDGEVVEPSIEMARYYLELADQDRDHRSAQELLIVLGRKKMIN